MPRADLRRPAHFIRFPVDNELNHRLGCPRFLPPSYPDGFLQRSGTTLPRVFAKRFWPKYDARCGSAQRRPAITMRGRVRMRLWFASPLSIAALVSFGALPMAPEADAGDKPTVAAQDTKKPLG